MDSGGIWRSFVDTGDPLCYLLAKRIERPPREKSAKTRDRDRSGENPRPTD